LESWFVEQQAVNGRFRTLGNLLDAECIPFTQTDRRKKMMGKRIEHIREMCILEKDHANNRLSKYHLLLCSIAMLLYCLTFSSDQNQPTTHSLNNVQERSVDQPIIAGDSTNFTVFGDRLPMLLTFTFARDDVIERATKRLLDKRNLILSGMAGIGKSTIILNVVEEFKKHFPHLIIWYIDTKDTERGLEESFRTLLNSTNRVDDGSVRRFAELQDRPLLIIFENVDHSKLLTRITREFMKKQLSSAKIHISIVTRCDVEGSSERPVEKVSLFSEEDAVRLLFHFASTSHQEPLSGNVLKHCDEGIAQLEKKLPNEFEILTNLASKLLDRHPLGISVAGSVKREFFADSWSGFQNMWIQVMTNEAFVPSIEDSSDDFEKSRKVIGTSIICSIRHLGEREKTVLYYIAFWGTNNLDIPLPWLAEDPLSVVSSLSTLKSLNLVQYVILGEEGRVRSHSLVVESVWKFLSETPKLQSSVINQAIHLALIQELPASFENSIPHKMRTKFTLMSDSETSEDHEDVENEETTLVYDPEASKHSGKISSRRATSQITSLTHHRLRHVTKVNRPSEVAKQRIICVDAMLANRLEKLLFNAKKHPDSSSIQKEKLLQLLDELALQAKQFAINGWGLSIAAFSLRLERTPARLTVVGDIMLHAGLFAGISGGSKLHSVKLEMLHAAETNVLNALTIDKTISGAEENVVFDLQLLGEIYVAMGNATKARSVLREATSLYDSFFEASTAWHQELRADLAQALTVNGEYQEAQSTFEELLRTLDATDGPFYPHILHELGNLHFLQQDYDAAEPFFSKAVSAGKTILGCQHPYTITYRLNLALTLKNQMSYERAAFYYNESALIMEKTLGKQHQNVLLTTVDVADCLRLDGNLVAAQDLYREIVSMAAPDMSEVLIRSLGALAEIVKAIGNNNLETEWIHRQLVTTAKLHYGEDDSRVAHYLHELALVLETLSHEKSSEAISLYREALALGTRTLGETHPYVIDYMMKLHNVLLKDGRSGEAELVYQRLVTAGRNVSLRASPPDRVESVLYHIAMIADSKRDSTEAEKYFYQLIFSNGSSESFKNKALSSLLKLADMTLSMGLESNETGETLLLQAFDRSKQLYGADHRTTLRIMCKLALFQVYERNKERIFPQDANTIKTKLLEIEELDNSPIVSMADIHDEYAIWDELNLDLAEQYVFQLVLLINDKIGNDTALFIAVVVGIAPFLIERNRFGEAEELCTEAIKTAELLNLSKSGVAAHLFHELGLSIEISRKDYDRAEKLYQKAFDIGKKSLAIDHHHVITYSRRLGRILELRGKYEEAKQQLEMTVEYAEKSLHPDRATIQAELEQLIKEQGFFVDDTISMMECFIRRLALGTTIGSLLLAWYCYCFGIK
jgi:tetratricopeptide (TPR) repeat protein